MGTGHPRASRQPSLIQQERSLRRSLCRFCRNDYTSIFNALTARWEHPYGRKVIACEANPVREDPA